MKLRNYFKLSATTTLTLLASAIAYAQKDVAVIAPPATSGYVF